MKTITLKKISKSLAQKTLFTDVSFSIIERDRVVIVGNNGVGKSTLLKIMAGQESVDAGIVSIDSSIAYIAQEFDGDRSVTITDYLTTQKVKNNFEAIVKKFGVVSLDVINNAKLSELSGGQLRVLQIASILSRGPLFLCIDEPENHLDIKVRSVLMELLRDYHGAVIMVSHDHSLINSLTRKIILIEDEKVSVTTDLTYEQLVDERLRQQDIKQHEYAVAKRKLAKMTNLVIELRRQTTFSDSKAKTYQMKKKQLAIEQENLDSLVKPNVDKPDLKIGKVEQKNGKLIVQLNDVTGGYDGNLLFAKVDIDIRFGQKICVLGRNGAGKSTLLGLMVGKITPQKGVIRQGVNIRTVVFSQQAELLVEYTAFELFAEIGIEKDKARSILLRLLFTKPEMDMLVGRLSGGQKQRLRLALLFYANPDFIVLDEPTNNLDPINWQFLLELLNEFKGTVLCVSHDRYFIESINEPILYLLTKKTLVRVWDSVEEVIKIM